MRRDDIELRDPYVLPRPETGTYYLYGTTDPDPWKGQGIGFDVYESANLENWDGPYPAFRPELDFWGTQNFWAPEVHEYDGGFFMFASFKSPRHERATQILRADSPRGPFRIHSPRPVTPPGWECLDGTFFMDDGQPWLVFCHEWVQVNDGEIWAIRLSPDLTAAEGEPHLLFRGSQAAWTKGLERRDGSGVMDARVTDGPFLYKTAKGALFLLWSSISPSGYALGAARSESSSILGPWKQEPYPLLSGGRGHGMVFKGFDRVEYLAYHFPNLTPNERFRYRKIEAEGESIAVGEREL